MKLFSRFSILASAATYFLIFVGGLVRVSGAGLGCPDWPKCFGSWIPPLHISQLPPGFDPAEFNFTLAWIEYINRLVGMTVGMLIATVGVWAIVKYRKYPSILIPSILASLLVAYQGWQGSQVVSSELEPFIVTIHMGLAFIIASLMVYVATRSYLMSETNNGSSVYPERIRFWLIVLWIVTILQVLLGTQVREAFETAVARFPLANHIELFNAIGNISNIHTILGIATTFFAWGVAISILNRGTNISPIVKQSCWILLGLSVIQMLSGSVLFIIDLTAVIQVMHMWIASMMTGIILILYSAIAYNRRKAR